LKFTISLKKNEHFKQVFNLGKVASNQLLTVFAVENNLQESRLGISVSKKNAGKAVVRNKLKRRIKEAYRLVEPAVFQGYDIVMIPKAAIIEASFADILSAMKRLFKRQGLYR